jgi:phage terminase small subunit
VTPRPRMLKPPGHLKPATRRWWLAICANFELEPHHERLLTLAGTAWDRAEDARAAIDTHGAVYVNRHNEPRVRPEVAIERDARLAFARLLRELRLDVAADDDVRIPPLNGGRPHA